MPRREDVSPGRPLTVAHRAANSPTQLARAEALGVDLIEADVRWHRGRLEVRHSKTMGAIPLLWDRWSLERGWGRRFLLEELIELTEGQTELMLDIKGGGEEFALRVREAMRAEAPGVAYSVCSQFWHLLEPFRDEPGVRVIHSVGNERMLREVVSRLTWHDRHAISIHRRLLSPARVAMLLEHAPTVMSWPVNDRATLARLTSWGVNGVISDRLDLLAEVVARPIG